MKHARNFTDLEYEKETAHVVHIDENGHLFMTDSILGVLAKNACPDNPNRTITLDGKLSKVPVFNYSQFFGFEITETLELDVKEILLLTQALEAVKNVEGTTHVGAFRFYTEDDQYKIFYKGIEFTSTYHLMAKKSNQSEVNINFDVSRLTKAFKLLKDLGVQTCNMQFTDKFRPCYFSSVDESIRVVVMPCRTSG